MVALGKEGALSGPFSPLHVLCTVLGGWCLTGGSPRPVGALEASAMAQGETAWCGCGEQEGLCGLPAKLATPKLLWAASCFVHFCFSLCCAQRMLLLHPALEQRPPGAGTRDSGSRDISTGLLWLALNCSKIHRRNTLGEEGSILFPSIIYFFLKCKVKCPCSMASLWQILGKLVQPAPVWAGRALPALGALPGSTGV